MEEVWQKVSKSYPQFGHLITSNSVGELMAAAGFGKALSERIKKPIALFVPPGFSEVVKILYPDRFVQITELRQAVLRSASKLPGSNYSNLFPTNALSFKGSPLISEMHDLFYNSEGQRGLSFFDQFRMMLGLDITTPWEMPLADKLKLPGDRLPVGIDQNSAIFFLGNNTNYPLKSAFWNRLQDRFIDQGLTPFAVLKGSMIFDNELTLNKTQFIELDMAGVLYATQLSKRVVSCSNGLVTLAAICCGINQAQTRFNLFVPNKICTRYKLLKSHFEAAFDNAIPKTLLGGEPCYETMIPNIVEKNFHAELDSIGLKILADGVFAEDQQPMGGGNVTTPAARGGYQSYEAFDRSWAAKYT